MINWERIKNLFGTKRPQEPEVPQNWTLGERDENNFARLSVDGKETKITMLVWSEEEVERLQEIRDNIEKNG